MVRSAAMGLREFWIPATIAGMAVGLAAGAALVDYGIDRGDLALMGAVNGAAVGVMQALVLHGIGSRVRSGGPSRTRLLGRSAGS